MFRALLAKGAPVNVFDSEGKNALQWYLEYNGYPRHSSEVVKLFLRCGFDVRLLTVYDLQWLKQIEPEIEQVVIESYWLPIKQILIYKQLRLKHVPREPFKQIFNYM